MINVNPLGATKVIVGVDTHRDEHVAVAVDWLGARLGGSTGWPLRPGVTRVSIAGRPAQAR